MPTLDVPGKNCLIIYTDIVLTQTCNAPGPAAALRVKFSLSLTEHLGNWKFTTELGNIHKKYLREKFGSFRASSSIWFVIHSGSVRQKSFIMNDLLKIDPLQCGCVHFLKMPLQPSDVMSAQQLCLLCCSLWLAPFKKLLWQPTSKIAFFQTLDKLSK